MNAKLLPGFHRPRDPGQTPKPTGTGPTTRVPPLVLEQVPRFESAASSQGNRNDSREADGHDELRRSPSPKADQDCDFGISEESLRLSMLGGFGTVYLGKLENGKEVAVKILDRFSQQGTAEFLNEVNLLSRVHHKNLVRLLGYCQDEEQVLIYEFAEEGSIWDHLHGGRQWLDWKQRLNIAFESACGLEYLHTSCSPRIINRDVKSENILST